MKKCRAEHRKMNENIDLGASEARHDIAAHEARYVQLFVDLEAKVKGLQGERLECNRRVADARFAPATPSASSAPAPSTSEVVTAVIGNFSGLDTEEVIEWSESLLAELGAQAEVYRKTRPRVAFVEVAPSGDAWRAIRRFKKLPAAPPQVDKQRGSASKSLSTNASSPGGFGQRPSG